MKDFFCCFLLVKSFANGFYITDVFALSLQALKRDIINTLSDRCEILFEDLIINEGPHRKSRNSENKQLIFTVNFGSCRKLCWCTEVPLWLEQNKKQMAKFLFGSLDFFLNRENFCQVQICYLASQLAHKVCVQFSWLQNAISASFSLIGNFGFLKNSVVETPVTEVLTVTSTYLIFFFVFKSLYGIPINIEVR